MHAALAALEHGLQRARAAWSDVSEAHAALHGAIVAASESPRIVAAHAALTGELLLFLLQLQPHIELGPPAEDHAALVAGLEREGRGCCGRTCASRPRRSARASVDHDRADDVRSPARLMRRGSQVPRGEHSTIYLP